MVLSLLFIGAIPTTIGTCEAISVQKKQANEAKRSAKFNLVATCDSDVKEKLKEQVDGKIVVLRNGKLYLDDAPEDSQILSGHPFSGYYFQYPSEEQLEGLVSTISNDPPMLNWIFIDRDTLELKYGNRTAAQSHIIGPWGWTEDETQLTIEEQGEALVVVQEKDGCWGLYYDKFEDWDRLPEDGSILEISLQRKLVG